MTDKNQPLNPAVYRWINKKPFDRFARKTEISEDWAFIDGESCLCSVLRYGSADRYSILDNNDCEIGSAATLLKALRDSEEWCVQYIEGLVVNPRSDGVVGMKPFVRMTFAESLELRRDDSVIYREDGVDSIFFVTDIRVRGNGLEICLADVSTIVGRIISRSDFGVDGVCKKNIAVRSCGRLVG